jgi:2Fe-2S ferredoxin
MIKIRLYPAGAPEGPAIELEGKPGQSLMQAAVAANVDGIAADCGGSLTCATCHVYVREPFSARLGAPSADETAMLEFTAAPRRSTSRLSCQIPLDDDLDGFEADLPPTQY